MNRPRGRSFRLHRGILTAQRRCLTCGCTDRYGCDVGCEWISVDTCSRCRGRPKRLSITHRQRVTAVGSA